jgi:hypothetical protein
MESKADQTILYLHPDGKYELKRYALARGPQVKVHNLLLEALRNGQSATASPRRCACLQKDPAVRRSAFMPCHHTATGWPTPGSPGPTRLS